MNGLHDTPAMKDSAKYSDFEYTMAIIPSNFGTHVGETALPVFGKPTPRQAVGLLTVFVEPQLF